MLFEHEKNFSMCFNMKSELAFATWISYKPNDYFNFEIKQLWHTSALQLEKEYPSLDKGDVKQPAQEPEG